MKKGVSLITVLLFMLVATIAATATFKWLNSEGRSSASRLMMTEAAQASVSGIEAARAWMTNHGNETGALVRQFNTNKKKPIRLNPVLKNYGSAQSYDVWLTDVNVSGGNYYLKVVSNGIGRNGSKHSEAAIFDVKGLYQIQIPEDNFAKAIDFHQSYYGGTIDFTSGGIKATSMIINGDWTGNPSAVDSEFVVTGKATLSGNNVKLSDKNNCIGGDFAPENNGVTGGNLYVGGNAIKFGGELSGNVYLDGNLSPNETGDITIHGNTTLNGMFIPNDTRKNYFNGNFCLQKENAQIDFQKQNQNTPDFQIGQNVWMPSYHSMHGNSIEKHFESIVLGNSKNADVFIKNIEPCTGKYNLKGGPKLTLKENGGKNCPENGAIQGKDWSNDHTETSRFHLFSTKGKIHGEFDNTALNFDCGESIKEYCNGIWEEGSICNNGAKYKVKDLLKTAISVFSDYSNTDCVSQLLQGENSQNNNTQFNIEELNNCWINAKSKNELFNDYLVIKADGGKLSSMFAQPQNYFTKKFFFIATSQLDVVKLPPTKDDSYVMFYLENGAKSINQVKNTTLQFNYFIYSTGDILTLLTDAEKWTGTFYFPSESCAGIKRMETANATFEFNQDLIESLTGAELICNIDVINCGGEKKFGKDDEELEEDEADANGIDPYHIAVGPQLYVTISSQYKNEEEIPADSENIEPSILVLPRVIYIPKDAIGELSDYYSVIGLNGAKIDGKATPTALTPNAPPASGKLVPGNTNLQQGVYTYKYSEGDYASRFYVQVLDKSSKVPSIHFSGNEGEIKLNPNSTHSETIKLVVPGATGAAGSFSIDIAISPKLYSGWNITPIASGLHAAPSGNLVYTYTGVYGSETQEIDLFTLTTDSDAESGMVKFSLQNPVKCIPSAPKEKIYSIGGHVSIERKDLTEYCAEHGENAVCTKYKDLLTDTLFDCSSSLTGTWVYPFNPSNDISCITDKADPNSRWTCTVSSNVTLHSSNTQSECEIVIPTEDNTLLTTEDRGNYTLYASAVRKQHTLTIELIDRNGSSKVNVYAKKKANSTDSVLVSTCNDEKCEINVYSGLQYVLHVVPSSNDEFSKWECTGPNCLSKNPGDEKIYPIFLNSNHTIKAFFNAKDLHCFYEDFSTLKAFCDNENEEDCIMGCDQKDVCILPENKTTTGPSWYMMFQLMSTGPTKASDLIDKDRGAIYNKNTKNGNNSNGKYNAVILSRAEAGEDGIMTALFQTAVTSKQNSFLNSGFILRSNNDASGYLMLSIYGDGNQNGLLTARACIGSGQSISSSQSNKSKCVTKAFSSEELYIGTETMVKAQIEVLDDSLKIQAFVNDKIGFAKFDLDEAGLTDLPGNKENHKYVGFVLTEASFKLFDIGWASTTYGADCFNIPKVSCAFKANYLGGRIPQNEDVTPWVGVSSWYENLENDCTIEYLYNGCDNSNMNSGFYCMNTKDEGNPSGIGNSWGSKYYNFSETGPHGTTDPNGAIHRDAKVKVTCNGDNAKNSYLNGMIYSCGNFDVGNIVGCSENQTLSSEIISGSASSTQEVTLEHEINLRDASIAFNITEASEDLQITLVSGGPGAHSSEKVSLAAGAGVKTFSVNQVSSIDSFDPQKVAKILIYSEGYFTIESISTECPNVPSIENCTATINNGIWNLKADIHNADECIAKPAANSISQATQVKSNTCEGDSKSFALVETNKEGGTYEFEISVSKNGATASCKASGTYIPSAASSSSSQQQSDKFKVTCPGNVANQDPSSAINVTPTISGCENGCEWNVKTSLDFEISKGTIYNTDVISFNDVNGTDTQKYTLSINDKNGRGVSCPINVTFVQGQGEEACSDSKQEAMRAQYCPEFACSQMESKTFDNVENNQNRCFYTKDKPVWVNAGGANGCTVEVNGHSVSGYERYINGKDENLLDESEDGYIIKVSGNKCYWGWGNKQEGQ